MRGGNESHEGSKWIRALSSRMFEINYLTTNEGRKTGSSAHPNTKKDFGHKSGELSLVPSPRIKMRHEDAMEKAKGRINNTNGKTVALPLSHLPTA